MGREWLVILAWNVYVGNTPGEVRRNLLRLLREHRPHVVVLMEAGRMYGHLDGLGYTVVQWRSKSLKPGSQPAQGNIAILVRRDVKLLKRFALRMTEFWRGPKHGWLQDPRIYRYVKVKHDGKVWKIGGAHTPFGKEARLESRVRLRRWFKRTAPGRPAVLTIDANMSIADFSRVIAEPGGAKVRGDGIDMAGYKNCDMMDMRNLGRNGSDHPAMLYKFRHR